MPQLASNEAAAATTGTNLATDGLRGEHACRAPGWVAVHIAFDVDDTLVPCAGAFATEPPHRRWLTPLASEHLRCGSAQLFRQLRAAGHRLSVYTTSYRAPLALRATFFAYGAPLARAINQRVHDDCAHVPTGAIKYPPAFGIDLLVDDSIAIARAGSQHGFRVVRVDPSDADWTRRVLEALSG